MLELKITRSLRGRAVGLADPDTVIVGRNYRLWACRQNGESLLAELPRPLARRLIEPSRLLCRLLRHEIRGFLVLPSGGKIVASRQALYHGQSDDVLLQVSRIDAQDVKPPMTITLDSQGRILWGEYWGNPERRAVRLFASVDRGVSYQPVWTFPAGEIKHVHNIVEDRYDGCLWVFVGDQGREPGIARLSADLEHLDWLIRGEQRFRAVSGFVFADRIVYGTDTEKDYNAVYAVDKRSGRVEKLCDTPGSCIYACRFGRWYAVSTSVEYFEKFENRDATVWLSANASDWQEVYRAVKDVWSMKYFQFGSIVLPRQGWCRDEVVFSGQALKEIDDVLIIAEVHEA